MFHHVLKGHRDRWPPPEVSGYLGLPVGVVGENRLLPPVGSRGMITRSEAQRTRSPADDSLAELAR